MMDYARSDRGLAAFGRGFDSHRLHHFPVATALIAFGRRRGSCAFTSPVTLRFLSILTYIDTSCRSTSRMHYRENSQEITNDGKNRLGLGDSLSMDS